MKQKCKALRIKHRLELLDSDTSILDYLTYFEDGAMPLHKDDSQMSEFEKFVYDRFVKFHGLQAEPLYLWQMLCDKFNFKA